MGSNFFKTGGFGSVNAGKVGNFVRPVAKYTQYVSPGANMALQQGDAANRAARMPASTGPFAGVTPTLADANRQYQPRQPIAAPAAPVPPVNRAWMGGG